MTNINKKGRPISKITSSILRLKVGQRFLAPAGKPQATIASYVYNANVRNNSGFNEFVTTKVRSHGAERVAVERVAVERVAVAA